MARMNTTPAPEPTGSNEVSVAPDRAPVPDPAAAVEAIADVDPALAPEPAEQLAAHLAAILEPDADPAAPEQLETPGQDRSGERS
jgi:hypothetical protein